MASDFAQFEDRWLARLNDGAKTVFHHTDLMQPGGLHFAIANGFASSLGYDAIGFNWELLDAHCSAEAPRSAIGQLCEALSGQITNPSQPWLSKRQAEQCAADLLSCFDAASLTVVANRYDGLWNPISSAPTEWGFVCFDTANIALLLIAEA
ncbi:hypothetical protein [Erythrobacter sp. MTPC3]|uniref:hypothetical protein n=1 Tax=Erythrobacter sp. MTPC3 TaxID=3056564 RepID=UPI0036F30251